MDRPTVGSVQILRGNALALALADESVDLIVTSPPYFGLRSYQDGGVAVDSTGWGYLPGHAPIYVGLDGA